MNGDEAMCFGAAFIASNSSSSFKVRKVYLTQHPSREIQIKITPLNELGATLEDVSAEVEADVDVDAENAVEQKEVADDAITYEKDLVLYKRTDFLGQKKTIALTYDRAMKIDAYALNGDDTSEHLATFELKDLDEICSNDIATKPDTTKPKVSLSFELSRSNIIKLNKVSVAMDETRIETEKVKKEKSEEENSDEESANIENEEEQKEEADENQEQAEENDEQTENNDSQEDDEYEIIENTIKVPHTFPCDINENYHGIPVLSDEQMNEAKQRLKKLEQRDEDKLKTDEAKNEYEGLVYEVRAWLQEDENFPYMTEEAREDFVSRLYEAEDWLYDEGDNVGYKVY